MIINFEPGETNILCTRLDKSLHFYRDILNFQFVEEEEGAVRLKCGDGYYLLLPFAQSQSSADGYLSVATFSIDLLVNDLEAVVSYFKENDVVFAEDWEAGKPNFVIRDPDGLFIEVVGKGSSSA
ncbi:MAG: VOC family protein [Chloroflexi bacterium]|nr:MAG: VOC family protein [Chloroflexota bacterium]MBL1193357.1 VOC family protein [Chloroflexota bacterium]NOH10649.1 VOC family protein [Chloroflexota bacterium]